MSKYPTQPLKDHYDVVIVSGASSGASIAWHLQETKDFAGSILVVERDPSLQYSATKASNNCIRQQFATKINVEIARYGADFVKQFSSQFGHDPCVPGGPIRNFGYLYLSNSPTFSKVLEKDQQLQSACGAGTRILSAADVKDTYPFFNTKDLDSASLNIEDEGAFNALGMVDWMRQSAREGGVEYISNEVVGIDKSDCHVKGITLKDGTRLSVSTLVNAAGTRPAQVSQLADVDLPVEARRRYTYIFSVDDPLPQDLPLTIDPSGVHFRSYGGKNYLAGCPPIGPDVAVDVDDFGYAQDAWNDKILPVIRHASYLCLIALMPCAEGSSCRLNVLPDQNLGQIGYKLVGNGIVSGDRRQGNSSLAAHEYGSM